MDYIFLFDLPHSSVLSHKAFLRRYKKAYRAKLPWRIRMPEITLDCLGLSCPQPVLKCKEAISQSRPDKLIIRVDNEAARQNVTRFLGSQQYSVVHVQTTDEVFELTAEPA